MHSRGGARRGEEVGDELRERERWRRVGIRMEKHSRQERGWVGVGAWVDE